MNNMSFIYGRIEDEFEEQCDETDGTNTDKIYEELKNYYGDSYDRCEEMD